MNEKNEKKTVEANTLHLIIMELDLIPSKVWPTTLRPSAVIFSLYRRKGNSIECSGGPLLDSIFIEWPGIFTVIYLFRTFSVLLLPQTRLHGKG